MDNFDTIDLNSIGEVTGNPYVGKFKVKTLLSRRDYFTADLKRREIVGSVSPENAMPTLVGEAYMLGQLFVRIVEAPEWWNNAGMGLDLKDSNITAELFEATTQVEKKAKDAVKEKAQAALQKLAT